MPQHTHIIAEYVDHIFYDSSSLSLPPPAKLTQILDDCGSQPLHCATTHDLDEFLSSSRSHRLIWLSDLLSHHWSPPTHLQSLVVLHLLSSLEKSLQWTQASALYQPTASLKSHQPQLKPVTHPTYSSRSLHQQFHRANTRWLRAVKSQFGGDDHYHLIYANDPLDHYYAILDEVLG